MLKRAMQYIISAIIGVLLFGISLWGNIDLTIPAITVPQSRATLTFAVLGDVHNDVSHLEKAIQDLHGINSKMDVLILNGDTVDQGIKQQYDTVKKLLLRMHAWLPGIIIKNIGNHEFFDYNIKQNSAEDVQTFINRYLEFADVDKVYHDQWVNGYHFISLGSEDGNSQTNNSVKAYISPVQCQWLREKLAEVYVKGKPIFVFMHQPLNSDPKKGWVGTDQGDNIKKILSAYPEVILFTSHTHADLTDKSVMLNQPFTMVHTGAIHYTIVRDSAQGQGVKREPFIKGLYIEVNHNDVLIKGRDFKEGRWIFSQEIKEERQLSRQK